MYHLLIIALSLTTIHAQSTGCICSCCVGQSCTAITLPTVYVQSCTLETCIAQCRTSYSQCRVSYPSGIISAQCLSTTDAQYSCQCNCCNTGSATCSTTYVGTSIAYTCQQGACSISCNQQYPTQCVSNQNGQTQGMCTGLLTTSTTTSSTTTPMPFMGNTCSCSCCQSGANCSPMNVGSTSASQCSTTACTQACRTQFSGSCPSLSYLGQSIGTCTSQNSGDTRCKCNCCSATGCFNYDIGVSGGCSACDSMCRQQATCTNAFQVTSTCSTSDAVTFARLSFSSMLLAFVAHISASC